MKFPYYSAVREPQSQVVPIDLPTPWRSRIGSAAGYMPDPGLVDAVNVALLLGQPLLATGDPGTGKTQLAWHVCWRLGLGSEPLVFEAKSTSSARDLFYTFDMIGRFHAAQTGLAGNSNLDYLNYDALGKAVLLANERSVVEQWLPKDFVHDGPKRSVVLIDEIDKAPRDFPNDILNEVENMCFKVPELGNPTISAPERLKPILIITSNSEKSLPDAFLRRCVYYNIPFPKSDRLAEIVRGRIDDVRSAPDSYLQQALELFDGLRNAGFRKKPATAELLGWLLYLGDRIPDKSRSLRNNPEILSASLGALVKSAEDQEMAVSVLKEWLSKS
jgi:MoxR-like ATPase